MRVNEGVDEATDGADGQEGTEASSGNRRQEFESGLSGETAAKQEQSRL